MRGLKQVVVVSGTYILPFISTAKFDTVQYVCFYKVFMFNQGRQTYFTPTNNTSICSCLPIAISIQRPTLLPHAALLDKSFKYTRQFDLSAC